MKAPLQLFASVVVVTVCLASCKSESKSDPPPATKSTVPSQDDKDKAAAETKRKAEDAMLAEDTKKVTERVADFEKANTTELERWTDDVKKKVATLAAIEHRNLKSALKVILKSPHRSPENQARDKYRHPAETLEFFGLKPTSNVIEFGAGGGWYTEILAPVVAKSGKLFAVTPNPVGEPTDMQTAYGKRFDMFVARSPELFGAIKTVHVADPAKPSIGEAGSADLVIAIRELHNWERRDKMEGNLAAVHAVLADGGTFGVVQHRAPKDADPTTSAEKGYLPEAWLVSRIEKAGFKLEKSAEFNANPKDTKDYKDGVWTLPPNYRLGETDRAKYEALGESDRMTLRFTKIAAAAE